MIGKDRPNPLVTVIVITYNSSKFVLETLESIKDQNYRNIELIVSDDFSTDNTVDICRKWLAVNNKRFDRSALITVDNNTGIPANCNRGVKSAKGEWIKLIAGDDALLPTCIHDNVNIITAHPEIKAVQSIADVYIGSFRPENFSYHSNYSAALNYSEQITAQDQYQLLLRDCAVSAPTVFIKKELIISVGYFDESIPCLEDLPMWYKITKSGNKIYFLNASTALHRIHDSSIYHNKKQNKYYNDFHIKAGSIYPKYINANVTCYERWINSLNLFRIKLILEYFNNRNIINSIIVSFSEAIIYRIRVLFSKRIRFIINKR